MEYKLEKSVNHNIATIAMLLKRQVYKVIAENNLEITPDQWVIMYYLWEENGLSIGKLAEKSKKDFANVTRIVDKLNKLGYISKKKSETDSRSNHAFILPEANKIKDKVLKCMLETTEIALQGITESEQETLLSILNKIEKNILPNQ